MKVIIRADRKIGKEVIAEHSFRGKRIIDRVLNFLLRMGQKDIYIASDSDPNIRNTKNIPLSKIVLLKNKSIIDLRYIYDGSKLGRLIEKGKPLENSIITENKTITHLDNYGCISEEREWNPISGFYGVPMGIKLGLWLSRTKVSPNFITFSNLILSTLASGLVLLGGRLNLFLFGIWVIIFHLLDAVDGKLAKFKGQTTQFGKWIDGGGDKFILNLWYLVIASSLYLESGEVFFLFMGLILLFGAFMYNYLLLTSTAYFRNSDFDYVSKTKIKKNPLVRFILVFINMDIQIHFIIISAWIGRFDFLILFYSIYFNLMWTGYFLFYLIRYLKGKDVIEV